LSTVRSDASKFSGGQIACRGVAARCQVGPGGHSGRIWKDPWTGWSGGGAKPRGGREMGVRYAVLLAQAVPGSALLCGLVNSTHAHTHTNVALAIPDTPRQRRP
jgi:hypothetical protein